MRLAEVNKVNYCVVMVTGDIVLAGLLACILFRIVQMAYVKMEEFHCIQSNICYFMTYNIATPKLRALTV